MKKLRNILALTTLLGAASFVNAQVLNSSFESGTGSSADNWFQFGNAYREAAGAQSGTYSMKMFGNFTGGTNVTGAFQDFAISAGQSATAEIKALNASFDAMSGDNFAVLKLIYRDASNNDLVAQESARITQFTAQDQVQSLTASLGPAPVGTDHGSIFLLFVQLDTTPFAGGSTFFDDATLNVVPEPCTMLALAAGLLATSKLRRNTV